MLVSSGLTDTNSKVSVEMDPGLFDLAVLFFLFLPSLLAMGFVTPVSFGLALSLSVSP